MIKTKEELKQYRELLGLTQNEFASLYGGSERTICRLEAGTTKIENSFMVQRINTSIKHDISSYILEPFLKRLGASHDDISIILTCYENFKKIKKIP